MKIAVVGSGVSGLAATWALNEYSDHEVHLYEAEPRVGGHINTVEFSPSDKTLKACNVDTAFIAFNRITYPNFLSFLDLYKAIQILPITMSFGVSKDDGAYEWSGKNIWSFFNQRKRLLDPGMWRLLYDLLRFNTCATRLLYADDNDDESIGDFLSREGYSDEFRDNYLLPMAAGIWSTPTDTFARNFRARTLVRYMYNHRLLNVSGNLEWLTIKGGSKNYVDEIINRLPKQQLHTASRVQSITTFFLEDSLTPQVLLQTEDGRVETCDRVILACHSNAALSILRSGGKGDGTGGIRPEENRILGMFRWVKNECVMHNDIRLMPRNRDAWSCWNYVEEATSNKCEKPADALISITFNMNELQRLSYSEHGPVLVTLNPLRSPRKETILGRWSFDHIMFDSQAEVAQRQLENIQGIRSIYYAGAYLKYGFHEDGFTSGLHAAIAASGSSVKIPFDIVHNIDEALGDNVPYRIWFIRNMFDILEYSNLRKTIGKLLGLALGLLRFILCFFLDISW